MSAGVVSVIIPTHNRAGQILDAVRSALAQGDRVGEVIVVDDGSTDDTAAVLATVKDARLRLLRQECQGPAIARDTGWRAARGPWIQFLDSDDGLAEGALTALLKAAEQNPDFIPIGETSIHPDELDAPVAEVFSLAEGKGSLLPRLLFFHAGTILASLMPKTALEAVGGFSGGPKHCEDFDLALRLAVPFPFVHVPLVTYRTRMHAGNRHREHQRTVWLEAAESVQRRVPASAAGWLNKRRSLSYFNWLVADDDFQHGQWRAAAAGFGKCLLWWPVKRHAWRGLFVCLGRMLRGQEGAR